MLLRVEKKMLIGKKIQSDKLQEICKGIYQINNNVQVIILSNPLNINDISQFCQNLNLPYVVSSYKTESILDAASLIKKLDLIYRSKLKLNFMIQILESTEKAQQQLSYIITINKF